MASAANSIEDLASQEYKYGFTTELEVDALPPGLSEEIIRIISSKKDEPEFMLEWRLKAYRQWRKMTEPTWQNVSYPPIDYDSIVYYSAPKQQGDGPKSLDEVDPEILRTFEKLGIPLEEQKRFTGVAVDAMGRLAFALPVMLVRSMVISTMTESPGLRMPVAGWTLAIKLTRLPSSSTAAAGSMVKVKGPLPRASARTVNTPESLSSIRTLPSIRIKD